jgi:prepilin-type processing-associated H-X9-DG protein
MNPATSKKVRITSRFNAIRAFTMTELLVVVGTLAVLSTILLPVLAGSKAQTKVTACTANFRQWTVSVNLYAGDHQGYLPRLDWNGAGGSLLWDVSTNMVTGLGAYGLAVPTWFCPVRPNEFDSAQANLGRSINTVQDLQAAFNQNSFQVAAINHNWWVQRSEVVPATSSTTYPVDPTQLSGGQQALFFAQNPFIKNTPLGLYGTPSRSSKGQSWSKVPFISDKAVSANTAGQISTTVSSNPQDTSPLTAHFVNGVLLGVNAAYADGHVETHNPSQMRCGYNQGGTQYWFY